MRTIYVETQLCICCHIHSQPRVEPRNGLFKCLIGGKADLAYTEVGTDSKPMGDAAIEVKLVGYAKLCQDLLRLVAQFRGEDRIGFWWSEKIKS